MGRPNNTNKRSFESLNLNSQDNAGAGHLVESWTRRSQFLRRSRAPPGPCKGCGKTFPRRPSSSARWPRLTRTSSTSGSGRLRSRWPRSAARLKKSKSSWLSCLLLRAIISVFPSNHRTRPSVSWIMAKHKKMLAKSSTGCLRSDQEGLISAHKCISLSKVKRLERKTEKKLVVSSARFNSFFQLERSSKMPSMQELKEKIKRDHEIRCSSASKVDEKSRKNPPQAIYGPKKSESVEWEYKHSWATL